jgi:hypothetical protein
LKSAESRVTWSLSSKRLTVKTSKNWSNNNHSMRLSDPREISIPSLWLSKLMKFKSSKRDSSSLSNRSNNSNLKIKLGNRLSLTRSPCWPNLRKTLIKCNNPSKHLRNCTRSNNFKPSSWKVRSTNLLVLLIHLLKKLTSLRRSTKRLLLREMSLVPNLLGGMMSWLSSTKRSKSWCPL